MPSLRRLIKGLSALFWGLPITLLVCVQSSITDWLKPLGAFPPIAATALLLYGLFQLGHFQKQERVWRDALDVARLFGVVNLGLSPFIFLWNKLPHVVFYTQVVSVMALSSLLFLFSLNRVLQRLTAMLPDETLRAETKLFTGMNIYLMAGILVLVTLFLLLRQIDNLPQLVIVMIDIMMQVRQLLLLFMVLLPLAMTMTLLWKIKEIVLSGIFGQDQ
ncbi:MAG: hypothetical protein HYZ36_08950 [Pedosphaera parvula]|nr:hypothetical protein [Pedosphaera parvula]